MTAYRDVLNRLVEFGRVSFGAAILVFGIQQFIYNGFITGLTIIPESVFAHTFWAYATGLVLVAAGAGIMANKSTRLSATVLGLLFLLCLLLIHVPRLSAVLRDGTERTRAFETLAICGGALILAANTATEPRFRAWNHFIDRAALAGLLFLAISLAVFGVDHFMFAAFVATLIPSWIPWHLFWTYLTGIGFVLAGVAIATQKGMSVAAMLLGLMFLLWVVIIHAPRVATHLHNGNEWNSAFVALALAGSAFIVLTETKNGMKVLGRKQT